MHTAGETANMERVETSNTIIFPLFSGTAQRDVSKLMKIRRTRILHSDGFRYLLLQEIFVVVVVVWAGNIEYYNDLLFHGKR
jgi:hypothetical protein